MTEVVMNKVRLVGSGYAEMPQDGRRFRFLIERYRHDDGSEWGQIVSMEEIPDVGPYLWVPSYGVDTEDEMQHMVDEYEYEQKHPSQDQQDWDAMRTEQKRSQMERYNELRDERAALIKKSPRTLGGQ